MTTFDFDRCAKCDAKDARIRALEAQIAALQAARLARADDPDTSKKAARAIAGQLGRLQREVLEFVRRHPDRTSTEIAHLEGIADPRRVNRRVSELAEAGVIVSAGVRVCEVTGREATIWRAP